MAEGYGVEAHRAEEPGLTLVSIVIGAVYLLVAKGIANGSPTIWSAVLAGGIQALLGLIVLSLLYSIRARQYFGT